MRKLVAIPVGRYGVKGSYLDFWEICLDTGEKYPHGSIRFIDRASDYDSVRECLIRAKREYKADMEWLRKHGRYIAWKEEKRRQRERKKIEAMIKKSMNRQLGV